VQECDKRQTDRPRYEKICNKKTESFALQKAIPLKKSAKMQRSWYESLT